MNDDESVYEPGLHEVLGYTRAWLYIKVATPPEHLKIPIAIALRRNLIVVGVDDVGDEVYHYTDEGEAEWRRLEAKRLSSYWRHEGVTADEQPASNGDKPTEKRATSDSPDLQAVAFFLQDKSRTKTDIARLLGKKKQSLTPDRYPELDKVMRAWKAPDKRLRRGTKAKDGTIEAEDDR